MKFASFIKVLPDRFLVMLGILLLGYVLIGKSWAYLGIAPLYAGELTLIAGVAAALCCRRWRYLFSMWIVWLLVIFMAWGALRTIPYVGQYKIDAIRDAVLWGYASFALIIAIVLIDKPERLVTVVNGARKAAPYVLVLGPFVVVFSKMFFDTMPEAPWAKVGILQVKGGDFAVHVCGVMAMIAAGMLPVSNLLAYGFVLMNIGANVAGRAALVAIGGAMAMILVLRPGNKYLWNLFGVGVFAFIVMLLTGFTMNMPDEDGRKLSAAQMVDNLASIFSDRDESLDGTKEWRLMWWKEIVHYTFEGHYFWTGKGYGVNLADSDGFQVIGEDSSPLRSPHNGHLTFLARSGVPGITLWALLQVWFALSLLNHYYVANRNRDHRWSALFIVLMAYWIALILNATFDVYLEGPMGGIWYWTIIGVGIASMWIHKNRPEVLYETDGGQRAMEKSRVRHSHRRPQPQPEPAEPQPAIVHKPSRSSMMLSSRKKLRVPPAVPAETLSKFRL